MSKKKKRRHKKWCERRKLRIKTWDEVQRINFLYPLR